MNLEFKLYGLETCCKQYEKLVQDTNELNEFIVVGEELLGGKMDCYKVHQIGKKGLVLIGGLNIDETALLVEKTKLNIKGDNFSWESVELDIPKQYFTLEIIENIQRLNS